MNAQTDVIGTIAVWVVVWISSWLGLPPEPRDPALLQTAPRDSILYMEWAPRSAGVLKGVHFEGLIGDPEIQGFLKDLDESFRRLMLETFEGSAEAEQLASGLPDLLRMLLVQPGNLAVSYDSELVAAAVKKSAEQGTELTRDQQTLAGIVATMVLNLGEEADLREKQIAGLVKIATQSQMPTESATPQEGLKGTTIPLPIPGITLTLHRHKNYLILSTQPTVIPLVVQGLDGSSRGLESQPRFQEAMKSVHLDRTGSLLWFDCKGLSEVLATKIGLPGIMANGVLAILGLDRLDSFTSTTGLDSGRVVTRNWLNTGGQTSKVLTLVSGKGIPSDLFGQIPRDADLVISLSSDIPKLIQEAHRLQKAIERPEMDADFILELQSHLQELGIPIPELLKPFADHITLYDAPGSGGFVASGLVGLIEIQDREAASQLVNRLVRLMREQLPPFDEESRGTALSEGEFLGHRIYYLDQIHKKPVLLNPAFCLTEKYLVIGMHPQALKSHLRLLSDANQPRFSDLLQAGENGFVLPEGKLLFFRHLNLESTARIILPFLPYGAIKGSGQLQLAGLDLKTLSIPSNAAFLPYLKNHFSAVVRREKGVYYEGQGSVPPQWIDWILLTLPFGLGAIGDELSQQGADPPLDNQTAFQVLPGPAARSFPTGHKRDEFSPSPLLSP